jgi:hypothetical protein
MHGGCIIFSYKAARLVGCLVLLSLSLATLILEESGQIDSEYLVTGKKHWGKKHRKHRHPKDDEFTNAEWLQVALCLTTVCFFLYTGSVRSQINAYHRHTHLS